MDNICEMESKTTPNHSHDKYYFCKKCRKILCNHCYSYHLEHKNFSFSFDDFKSIVEKLKDNISMKINQETDVSEKINIFEDKINNPYPGKEINEMKKCINLAFNKVKMYSNNDENKNNFLNSLLNIIDALNTIEKSDKQSFLIFVDNEIEFAKIYKSFSENNPINQFEKFFADCAFFYDEFKKKINDEYHKFEFNFNKNSYNNINYENNNLLNVKVEKYENKKRDNLVKNENKNKKNFKNSFYKSDLDMDYCNYIKNENNYKIIDNVYPKINNKKTKIIEDDLIENNNFIQEPFLNLNEKNIYNNNKNLNSKIENDEKISIIKKQKIDEEKVNEIPKNIEISKKLKEKEKEISNENSILNQPKEKRKDFINEKQISNESKNKEKEIQNENSILNQPKNKEKEIKNEKQILNELKDKEKEIQNENSILDQPKNKEKEIINENSISNESKDKEKEEQIKVKEKSKEILNQNKILNQIQENHNSKINDKNKNEKNQKKLEDYIDKKKNIAQENELSNSKKQNENNIIFSFIYKNEDNHNFIFLFNIEKKEITIYQVYQQNNNIKFPFIRSKGININNSYYITGGYEKPNEQSNICFKLTYKDDKVTIKEDSKMNLKRASHNLIYIPSKNRIIVSSGENIKESEYLDLNNNNRKWVKFSKLNEYRANASMFCINERFIYCVGGYNFYNDCVSQGYEVLDLNDKNLFWKFYYISDLLNICLMGVVNIDDKNIILVGGLDNNNDYLDNVYHIILDDNKNKISSVNERRNIIDHKIMFYNSQNFISINNKFIGFDCFAKYIEYNNDEKIFKYDTIKFLNNI